MGRREREGGGGGCLVAVAVVLSIAFFALAAGLLYLVTTGDLADSAEVVTEDAEGAEESEEATASDGRSFPDYSWAELSEISAAIATAGSSEEAVELAASYGIAVGDTRTITLDDGTSVVVRVVGLCQDERADGTGVAGITLMTSPIALREMSSDTANEGGWEASELRAWLAADGLDLLPDDLAAVVVPVLKETSNQAVRYGSSDISGAVTQTADALWVPSMSEVCGAVTIMTDEYGSSRTANTEYVAFAPYDELLSSEGEQYAYFASLGISGASQAWPALVTSYSGQSCAWWLRTSYPFTYSSSTERFCYQVMASGLPSGLVAADDVAGVVVGFCL